MAGNTGVARRYAEALFAVAEREQAADAILKDLRLVASYFEHVPYFKPMVMQPVVSMERKRRVLSDAFGDRTTATTLNFLYLLVAKRRVSLFEEIVSQFQAMVDKMKGRLMAEVHTAIPLQSRQLNALKQALDKRTGKNIVIDAHVDPTMIAGMRVRLGDTIIDGSVSGRLERVRRQLLGEQ